MSVFGVDAIFIALILGALILAFASGLFLWGALDQALSARTRREAALRDAVSSASVGDGLPGAPNPALGGFGGALAWRGTDASALGLDVRVLEYAGKLSRALRMGKCRRLSPAILASALGCNAGDSLRLAGVGGEVDLDGFCEASVRLAFVLGAGGLAVGWVFSSAMGALLLAVGMVFGSRLPMRAASRLAEARAAEMERSLPEMLDVVALGMRSGMSFDASLLLYERHFKTPLARELSSLQSQWSSGLVFRDDALRELAATYDSMVFGRVVETIIRSVRYGSSMVESLEGDAAEARAAYQASREEHAAKAPVKMMVPTGVLILPAMLILVLGPVLLELMDGGL